MDVDSSNSSTSMEQQESTTRRTYYHLDKIVRRKSVLSNNDFEPDEGDSEGLADFLRTVKVLIIGAGGLGCELLKDLALMGFENLSVIDMDTIDISNLNRQFLFRATDVGRSKAQTAADFVRKRVPRCNVTAYHNRIQDFDPDWYAKFNIVVCGLDSVDARRWINATLCSLDSPIPLIDGGTEGFKGSCRVVIPGSSACIECNMNLFTPQVNFPLCTLAHTPRLPEHCIEYVRVLQYPECKPFGEVPLDADDPVHLEWCYRAALERAQSFGIQGVTIRLTKGVLKRIIPAVASTNAVIAAACATECFKFATYSYQAVNNFMNFSDSEGIYTYTFETERNPNCLACAKEPITELRFAESATLQSVFDHLQHDTTLQLRSPSISTIDRNNQKRTLYFASVESLREQTKQNLEKTLKQLEIEDGQSLFVSDATTPKMLTFCIKFEAECDASS